jgi:hypothetical protein
LPSGVSSATHLVNSQQISNPGARLRTSVITVGLVDLPSGGWGKLEKKISSTAVYSIDMVEESAENVVPATTDAGKKAKPAAPGATDATAPTGAEKTVAPKKEKPPALEAKPFTDFIHQDYLPALTQALTVQGITDLQVDLEQSKIAVKGFETAPECSQVIGRWDGGKRQFNVYFFDDSIQGQRAISCVDRGIKSSTIEPFLIDERKITLDLLVSGVVLRLNSQKWLMRN